MAEYQMRDDAHFEFDVQLDHQSETPLGIDADVVPADEGGGLRIRSIKAGPLLRWNEDTNLDPLHRVELDDIIVSANDTTMSTLKEMRDYLASGSGVLHLRIRRAANGNASPAPQEGDSDPAALHLGSSSPISPSRRQTFVGSLPAYSGPPPEVASRASFGIPPPPPCAGGSYVPPPPLPMGRGLTPNSPEARSPASSPAVGRSSSSSACVLGCESPAPSRSTSSMSFGATTPKSSPSGPVASSPPTPSGSSHRLSRVSTPKAAKKTSRIDPEQVPRPLVQSIPVTQVGGEVYTTLKYTVPPAPNTVCTILDNGSASCEFVRISTCQIPAAPSTANAARVPVVAYCQPFAELTAQEEHVPLVDFGETGPLRCSGCRAYANPFFSWQGSGRAVTCNFCAQHMDVSNEHCCPPNPQGHRDLSQRPELRRGSVDYVAPRDYSDTLPCQPVTIFVLDASWRALASGFFQSLSSSLRSMIASLEPGTTRVCVMAFDKRVHFFMPQPGRNEARRVVVSELEEPFVPCSADALCVDPCDEAIAGQLEAMLEALPELLTADQSAAADQVAAGPALKTAIELAVQNGGGHVIMAHAALPSSGIGALASRDDLRLYGTESESQLHVPQQGRFFDELLQECIDKGVAASVIAAPDTGVYLDLASLSVLPRKTGGDLVHFPSFDPIRDGEKLHYDICRLALQKAAFSCIFKLRWSKGLQAEAMLASWDHEVLDTATFQVPRLSVDGNVIFVLRHDERLETRNTYLQLACLYTDGKGRRLIRVHTAQFAQTTSISNLFRHADCDVVTNVLVKRVAMDAFNNVPNIKEGLTQQTVEVLHAYRVNCASTSAAGQLILPETLKMLPLYVGALRKMPCLRTGSGTRADDRIAAWFRLLTMPLAQSCLFLYPRLYPVLPMSNDIGLATGVGENVKLPCTVAASHERLKHEGAYLLVNGAMIHLYLTADASTELLQSAFGVADISAVPAALAALQEGECEEADRVMAMVHQIRRENHRLPWLPFTVVPAGTSEEARLFSFFVEDTTSTEPSYIEYLCQLHKLVQNKPD